MRAELTKYREDCRRSIPTAQLDTEAFVVRSSIYRLDELSRAHGISILAGPPSLNFTWSAFAMGAAVILTCFTAGIGSLGVVAMLRAALIATVAYIALQAYESRLALPERWAFNATKLSRAPLVTTIASVILVAWLCLGSRLSRRFRYPQLLSLCFIAPATATAALFDVQPMDSVHIASTSVAGIELPIPTYWSQEALVWLVVSYLLLTPIVTLSIHRLRALPEQR